MAKRVVIDGEGIWTRLQKKYSSEHGWALLAEVRNKTGYAGAERTADALAMNCWPSRGMELHGFEIKIDRGDVLRELKTPAKADGIQRYCDRWWLVLAGPDLIKPGELPPTWGLQVPSGKDGLKAVTEAPKLEAAALDRRFVASVLRNFHETYVPRSELRELREQIHREVDAKVEERLAREVEDRHSTLKNAHDHLSKLVAQFKESSGIDLLANRYDVGQVGHAVELLKTLALRPRYGTSRFATMADQLEAAASAVRDVATELDTLATPTPKEDAA